MPDSKPASETRKVAQNASPMFRDFAIPDGAINVEERTVELSFASELPYERWWGTEILEISGNAMRMDRLQNGAALLVDHDMRDQVGVIVRAWIDGDKKARALVRFGRSQRAEEIFQDVQDGIRKLVSVGYRIHEYVLESRTDAGETYRVTDWEPFEVSLVSVPADASVGVGRGMEHPFAVNQPSGHAGNQHQEKTMTGQVTTPAGDENRAAPSAPVHANPADILSAERARMAEISALGKQHGLQGDAERAIESGATVDAFRATVLQKLKPAATVTPSESRDIGMSDSEVNRFSFARALLVAMDPHNPAFRKAAAFELDASEAARNQRGEVRKERDGGITIPPDVMRANIAGSPEVAQAALRMMSQAGNGSAAFRDLVVGTGSAGGNLVATNLLTGSFIDMLRARARVLQMGATVLADLSGNIAIPRQTGGATCYWVGESTGVTESQPTFDQVALTPKTVGTFTDFSRRLLLQSSLDVEAFVRAELAISLAIAGLDYAALNGTGSGDQPTGLFNAAGVGSVTLGTNGAALDWAKAVEFETAIANANADVGSLAYLTNSKVRGKLKTTLKFANGDKEIWQPGRDPRNGIGEVNGYDAYVSNNISGTYTKGTSAGVCSGMAFGNWADLIIGLWGGLDLMLDPYTNATSGGKRVVALQDCDVAIRRPGSFAVSKDILTA